MLTYQTNWLNTCRSYLLENLCKFPWKKVWKSQMIMGAMGGDFVVFPPARHKRPSERKIVAIINRRVEIQNHHTVFHQGERLKTNNFAVNAKRWKEPWAIYHSVCTNWDINSPFRSAQIGQNAPQIYSFSCYNNCLLYLSFIPPCLPRSTIINCTNMRKCLCIYALRWTREVYPSVEVRKKCVLLVSRFGGL